VGTPVFTFRLPEGRFAPMHPVSYANAVEPGRILWDCCWSL